MALLGNYAVIHKSPAKFLTGTTLYGDRANWNKPGMMRSAGMGSGNNWRLASIPDGFGVFGAWMLPETAGAMTARYAARLSVDGLGNGAEGLGYPASGVMSLDAVGDAVKLYNGSGTAAFFVLTSGIMSGVVGASAVSSVTISGSAQPTGLGIVVGSTLLQLTPAGELSVILGLAGTANTTIDAYSTNVYAKGYLTGAISFSLGVSGMAVAQLGVPGVGYVTITASGITKGVGHLESDANIQLTGSLVSYALGIMQGSNINVSELTPEAIASAVWQSIATSFNSSGTMGNKVNSAASAGDPWTTALPGAYADGTAGKIIAKLGTDNVLSSTQQEMLIEIYRLLGLDPTTPLVVTTTTRTAGDIEQTISGDANTSVTVQRV